MRPEPAPAALETLAARQRAARILLVGTGVSGSALWLAPTLPPDGRLVVLEPDASQAAHLRAHLAAAGCSIGATVIAGVAARYLHKLAGPFDLVVVDARDTETVARMDRLEARLSSDGVIAVMRADGSMAVTTRQTRAVAAGSEDR